MRSRHRDNRPDWVDSRVPRRQIAFLPFPLPLAQSSSKAIRGKQDYYRIFPSRIYCSPRIRGIVHNPKVTTLIPGLVAVYHHGIHVFSFQSALVSSYSPITSSVLPTELCTQWLVRVPDPLLLDVEGSLSSPSLGAGAGTLGYVLGLRWRPGGT